MTTKNKHKELIPFKIAFTLIFLGAGAWFGNYFYKQHTAGLSFMEAVEVLKGSAEEAYIEYEAFVDEKIPQEPEETEAEIAARNAAFQERADKIILKSFGLDEMRKLVERAGAQETAGLLMKEVKDYQLLAIRSMKMKKLDECESYLAKARESLRAAEQKNRVAKQLSLLKGRFDQMLDTEAEVLLRLHGGGEAAPVLDAIALSREGWGARDEEAAMIYDAALLVYTQLLESAEAKQLNLELFDTREALKKTIAAKDFVVAEKHLRILELKGRSIKELMSFAQQVLPALPAGKRHLSCKVSKGCSLRLVWIPEGEGLGFWMAAKETHWTAYWSLFPKASKGGRRGMYPVRDISWFGANTFCKLLSKKWDVVVKLPRDNEWEWACAAGSTTRYSFGEEVSLLNRYANFADAKSGLAWAHTELNDGYKSEAPCGSFKPNAWGLWDMHGNVMEWTRSFYEKRNEGAAKDNPIVVRGGSWHYGPALCETRRRHRYLPELASNDIGFRIVVRL